MVFFNSSIHSKLSLYLSKSSRNDKDNQVDQPRCHALQRVQLQHDPVGQPGLKNYENVLFLMLFCVAIWFIEILIGIQNRQAKAF